MMIAAALCVAMVSTPTSAQTVREALLHYETLEFGKAVTKFEQALDDPELPREERAIALAYLARSYAVFRRRKAATRRFIQLLELVPDYRLASFESPLIREAFATAKNRMRTRPREESAKTGSDPPTEGAAEQDSGGLKAPPSRPLGRPNAPTHWADEGVDSQTTFWIVVGVSAAILAAGGIALAFTQPWKNSDTSLGTLNLP